MDIDAAKPFNGRNSITNKTVTKRWNAKLNKRMEDLTKKKLEEKTKISCKILPKRTNPEDDYLGYYDSEKEKQLSQSTTTKQELKNEPDRRRTNKFEYCTLKPTMKIQNINLIHSVFLLWGVKL